MRYVSTYRMLVRFGFSPAKAGEIVLDASRGEAYALRWVGVVFKTRRGR